MDRSAAVYSVNGRLIVASCPKTAMGVRLTMDPIVLRSNAGADSLGSAVTAALEASERVLPHPGPAEWKGSFDPFLQAAGVRSLKSFMASARLVDVDQTPEKVVVTPNRNCGAKDGFEPLLNEAEAIAADPETVAEAVLRRLS